MKAGPLGEQSIGDENAPVTVIEYASLTCGHCANFHTQTFPEIKKKYVETGKVRFIFREFPFDPRATAGFMLSRCAPSDRYFDMLGLLFSQMADWAFTNEPVKVLFNLSKQVGFTQETFNACLTNQELLDGVSWVRDYAAKEFEVNSTPTFFINGQKQVGALTVEEMSKLLDEALGG
ncbi:MAG: disulfide bond formation protein DsbA [Hyphomicrobiales bacterium]|nr:MAG: disulfide bond formation protein DsbA [Hyphomicrobiales bacterium]